ncbi:MAG: hypothetical protein HKN13_04760 [Rhodothermales bacterium]|nr:hypothetical protein [Rhodothermales bacterium]
MTVHPYRILRPILGFLVAVLVFSGIALSANAQPSPDRMKQRFDRQVAGAMKALALEGARADTVQQILQSAADKKVALAPKTNDRQAFANMRE